MKNKYVTILILLTIITLVLSGCIEDGQNDGTVAGEYSTGTLKTQAIDFSEVDDEKMPLVKYYSLEPLDIELKAAQYDLPLQMDEISNYDSFSGKVRMDDSAVEQLSEHGFVVISNPFNPVEESISDVYGSLEDKAIPNFITSDSILHIYHIQFDETLRQIEEDVFYDAIWSIDSALLDRSMEDYNSSSGDMKEAAKNNVAYFSVALSLLKPVPEQLQIKEYDQFEWGGSESHDGYFTKEEGDKFQFEIPEIVREEVEAELELINKHSGFSISPVFNYQEDYSQYVPRGHYTHSEKLKNYFRTFMWHGRMSMLLKGDLIESADPEKDARIQTMSASLIASHMTDKEIMEKWDRVYGITAFYVGLSDDLGPYEYQEALNSVLGNDPDPVNLNNETIGELKAKLAECRSPEIYGGTGNCVILPPYTPEQADQCLKDTKGFRLMGQRFIPDSYMFSNLVGTHTGDYLGNRKPEPFTYIDSAAGPVRGFPQGLDMMALLGSERAKVLLDESDDSNYENYDLQYRKLEKEFDSFSDADWNQNLYWSQLYTLKPLLKEYDSGYPTFMQTQNWQDKELNTALASWTELRHDTILYSKPSFTGFLYNMGSTPETPDPIMGYVEPVPEFYNRLLALTRMTRNGLNEIDAIDKSAEQRLEKLETILQRLTNISRNELENKELTEEDYEFIRTFGDELDVVVAGVDERSQKTTIIADVHTDPNTGNVLEEGVGYVDLIVVAYMAPDGRILLGAGPAMSQYEFKHPMNDRLTDEKWREMLRTDPPERSGWTDSFIS
ncbi:DUF3160 domain-containing protein [Methanococcoides burtonii]|uniref:DUF3160 domain-containing protein n=1 Tax=Methanococcoides burtonii (strain DSM 6242 / NBRC 107633 / OCM 468 / ACE-M) TaxID=259564 RepID=Q12Y40_METBU|nr:DUF3160 domain-containing protein [Methanococcoides burtonii]ABE51636.1 Hypothetical protein Mbur_0667 [Methanococcoides burtonii DSM 6242]